ncbi:hypothetical protein [Nostoc phage YongM]|nr:hypothetical protein [Nostoc phage YongM]
MKLSNVLLSAAIGFTAMSSALPAIASESVFVQVPGTTSEGNKLFLDALSISNVKILSPEEAKSRGNNLRTFHYMIVTQKNNVRFLRAGVYCTQPGSYYVLQNDWSDKKIVATSNTTKTMLYAVCKKR